MARNHAQVQLGGVTLAGNAGISWRFTTGVAPYQTTMQCHEDDWPKLERQLGKPVTLKVTPWDGDSLEVQNVFVLHEVASDSPHRKAFLVSDARWLWQHVLIAKDFNIPKKSGDRTTLYDRVPVELNVVVDVYDFKRYSLKSDGSRWSAKDALQHVLDEAHRELSQRGSNAASLSGTIISMPVVSGEESEGHVLQNLVLRDTADAAISRMMSFIPGLDVYVTPTGEAWFYNSLDAEETEKAVKNLPPTTYSGQVPTKIVRKGIRPRAINVHYSREVECSFYFEDNWAAGTSVGIEKKEPFLENVVQVMEEEFNVAVWNPETDSYSATDVDRGTWVDINKFMLSCDEVNQKPEGSLPWTFETLKRHWFTGDLEGMLMGGDVRGTGDTDTAGNVMARIQSIRQHFRQTFRINPRYMERIRSLEAVRVAPYDPVTGARGSALVWSQYCVVWTEKGLRVRKRTDPDKQGLYRNYDDTPTTSQNLLDSDVHPSPARVQILDRDLGIFRVDWVQSPFGVHQAIVPCNLVDEANSSNIGTRALRNMDNEVLGVALQREGDTNGLFLADGFRLRVLLTIVPAAPNNRHQFARVRVAAEDLEDFFEGGGDHPTLIPGEGPELDVWIPPGEAIARYAWGRNDSLCEDTIIELLGTENDDPESAGSGVWPGPDLSGFTFTNQKRILEPHARAAAAEALWPYSDAWHGTAVTGPPAQGGGSAVGKLGIKGQMVGSGILVSAAPYGSVRTSFEFAGKVKPLSRFAMLPDAARHYILGEIPFKDGDR